MIRFRWTGELWRRLLVLILACAAVLLAKYAALSPLVLVKPVDFKEKQKKEGSYMGVRIMTGEKQRLLDMPLVEYTMEKTRTRLFQVEGMLWKEIAETLAVVKEDDRLSKKWSKQKIGKKWSRRLPSDQYPGTYLFFRPDEPPVNFFRDYFKQKHDEVYVSINEGNEPRYLSLQYRTYSDDNFYFGGGFSNPPNPPTYMLFPYRKYSLWLALFGLLFYIFSPVRQKKPNEIGYPRWRMVLGDVVSFLFIVPFFSLPFLITGGTIQAFTQGWPFLLFFWPISLIGIWLLFISAWFASFSVIVQEDRLCLFTYKGEREFPYADMEYFQSVIFKPPKCLIALSWLAALSGKGSAQIGAAGRAMILSGSASGSIGIRLNNGADIFINITDQMGNDALKGFKEILKKLKENGIPGKDEVREIRSLGLETMRLPDK